LVFEQLRAGMALFFADELDINLLPKVGYQWMPTGEQVEVLTPGTNEKRYLAVALDITTGTITHCVWYRKQTGLFLELLDTLDRTHPAPLFMQLTVVQPHSWGEYNCRGVGLMIGTTPSCRTQRCRQELVQKIGLLRQSPCAY